MKAVSYRSIEGKAIKDPQVEGVTMHVAVGPDDGAPNFTMRVFEVEPGGHTPHHEHDFEHEMFFHSGNGEVELAGKNLPVAPGHVAFIPAGALHQVRNTGDKTLVFVCVVPKGI